jgi:hypothetical protein
MNHLFTDKLQTNKAEFLELTKDILETNMLVIGEVHGVKENAFLYYSFFSLFEFDTIVLTYPQSLKEPIMNFLSTGMFPIHAATENMSDGNINKTYILLIKKLHEEGILKKIVFIEPDRKDFPHWNDKEKASFENMQAEDLSQNKTLVILGNMHTETEPFTIKTNVESEAGSLIPLMVHIRKHYGNVPLCKLQYHSGKYYNFQVKDFPKSHTPEHMLRKRKTKANEYEIHLENVTPAETF